MVRLDILVDDSFNRKYNIEVQKSEKGAGFKRDRYNSSLIDANKKWTEEEIQERNEEVALELLRMEITDCEKVAKVSKLSGNSKENGSLYKWDHL